MSLAAARAALLLALALLAGAAGAAPKAELWERWTISDPASTRVVDHSMWARFLAQYLVSSADGINRLRYGAVTFEDGGLLRVYLDDLQRSEVSTLNRAEQRAYWINLYNAQTVKLVLERYPVPSIMAIAISPGFFTKGPWGAKLLKVEDQTLSLDDIEHRILRPIWNDPRTHYALNCAALGCPSLAREPYTAAGMDAMLDAAARAYVNHSRGARVQDGRLHVSSIYTWFAADFGGADGVIAHLRRYAEPDLAARLKGIDRISGDAYDWRLNDTQ